MDWTEAQARLRAPLYAPLHGTLGLLPAKRWPTHAELTQAARGIETSRGRALRFVAPRGHSEGERRCYELHIADSGEVETRPESWHDLFNALAWIAFPKTKAMVNAQHAAILEERGALEARRRSPERDALTLFDEGGVIVASASPDLTQMIRDFEWKRLFWHERARLEREMRFVAFGHALCEQALEPYLGMVAKTVFVPFGEGFDADALAAAHFAARERFRSPKSMAPMPVLGVPGWHPGTATESFYDDTSHFRAKSPAAPRTA